jgi:hypothetical protein
MNIFPLAPNLLIRIWMFGSYSFCLLLAEANRHGHTSLFHANEALTRNPEGRDAPRCLYWRSFLHFRQSHRHGPNLAQSDQFEELLLIRFDCTPASAG